GSNKVWSRSRSTASRGAIAGTPRASRPCSRGTVLELRCRRRARSHDTGAIDDVICSRAEHARGASCAKQVANQDSDVVVMIDNQQDRAQTQSWRLLLALRRKYARLES